jgi:hypothetical protein
MQNEKKFNINNPNLINHNNYFSQVTIQQYPQNNIKHL